MENSADIAEIELGKEVSRYRRLPEVEILRKLGIAPLLYHAAAPFSLLGALYLSAPMMFLLEHLGARRPLSTNPIWGPFLIGWYCACALLLLWAMYVLPRRGYLAIHEGGFVFQGVFRCYTICYRDVAECRVVSCTEKVADPETVQECDQKEDPVISSASTIRLLLADKTRVCWKGIAFPPGAAGQLLKQLESHIGGTVQISGVDIILTRRIRFAGLLVGLLLEALVIATPVCDENGREAIRMAFGEVFFGLPSEAAVPFLLALLFAPMVLVFPHLMILQMTRVPHCKNLCDPAEINKACRAAIAGGIYFLILVTAWLIYASMLGI